MNTQRASLMTTLPRYLWILPAVILLGTTELSRAIGGESGPPRGGVIISWQDGTTFEERDRELQGVGALGAHHFKLVAASAVRLPSVAAQQILERNPRVKSVVPNRPMYLTEDLQGWGPAAPPLCTDCGGGGTPQGQYTPEHVKRVGALPGTLAFTGRNIGVAVVDAGVDKYHRDLTRADGTTVVGGFCFTADQNVPCDVDIWPGLGHGTGVAGVIAAQNNSVDIVGVAPDVRIWNVNVFRADLSNDDGLVMAGLDWIAANKFSIQVVNMSISRPIEFPENEALHDAVRRVVALGIPIAVAAGNDPTVEVGSFIPAAYLEVMAIASTTATWGFIQPTGPCASRPQVAPDTASAFTTDGKFDPITGRGVTISAPGNLKENIVEQFGVCVRTTTGVDLLSKGGGIHGDSGTSFSSPLVAGVVALMKEQAGPPGAALTPEGARTRIRSGADRIGVAPLDSTWIDYTFDGEREGILWAPGALQ